MTDHASNGEATGKLGLTVAYSSPASQPFSFTKSLDGPATDRVEARTEYLKALRSATLAAQDEINKELTARMEEDKARDAQGSQGAADDAKEEENYGEEVQEED